MMGFISCSTYFNISSFQHCFSPVLQPLSWFYYELFFQPISSLGQGFTSSKPISSFHQRFSSVFQPFRPVGVFLPQFLNPFHYFTMVFIRSVNLFHQLGMVLSWAVESYLIILPFVFISFCPCNFERSPSWALYSKNALLGLDLAGYLFDEFVNNVF